MRTFAILLLLSARLATAANTNLQILPGNPQRVVPLPNGNQLLIGSFGVIPPPGCTALSACAGTSGIRPLVLQVVNGSITGFVYFGRGNTVAFDAAVDSGGNVWVVGETDSDDFPLMNALFPNKVPYATTGFIAKFDPSFHLLFSTFLGGPKTQYFEYVPVPVASRVAVDSAGNAYVAGTTSDPSFPTTGPVIGSGIPGPSQTGQLLSYAFLVKLSPDGSKLLSSHLIGGDSSTCRSRNCIPFSPATAADSLSVDGSGNATIAGTTNTLNFPTTNAYQSSCPNAAGYLLSMTCGFILRLNPDASEVLWSTLLGGSRLNTIQVDSSGDVYVAGTGDIAGTPGALQPAPVGVRVPPANGFFASNGFVAKVNSHGSGLISATNLGGPYGATLYGLALDPAGNVWVAGNTKSAGFPGLPNVPFGGSDFALELNADFSALSNIFPLLPGTVTQPPVFDSTGNLLLLSSAGNLLSLNTTTARTAPGIFAMTNAAVLTPIQSLVPGEIATLFGVGLGQSPGISGEPDANGVFPTQLGGVSVQFSPTLLAPLLYVGPGQINFQVPFAYRDDGNPMTVNTASGPLTVPLQYEGGSSPVGIFQASGSNFAAALNQDGSVNGPSNPARVGSIVSLFLTGLTGSYDSNEPSGVISTVASPMIPGVAALAVGESGNPPGLTAEQVSVLYAGPAPGLINGVSQVNVQLPGFTNPQLTLYLLELGLSEAQVGPASNTVQIYAQ